MLCVIIVGAPTDCCHLANVATLCVGNILSTSCVRIGVYWVRGFSYRKYLYFLSSES